MPAAFDRSLHVRVVIASVAIHASVRPLSWPCGYAGMVTRGDAACLLVHRYRLCMCKKQDPPQADGRVSKTQ